MSKFNRYNPSDLKKSSHMEWINVKDEKPKETESVVFFQPSTEKYFVAKLKCEEVASEMKEYLGKEYDYFWVTATGYRKDMQEDDVWMSFPLYTAVKTYK